MPFWIFMLIMVLLIPGIMLGFGMIFSKHAPQNINMLVGYRTTRSMKNMGTWQFAHQYCSKLWKKIGLAMFPVSLIPMLFLYGKDTDSVGIGGMILVLIQTAALIGSIWPVERALKRNFDEDGNRKS